MLVNCYRKIHAADVLFRPFYDFTTKTFQMTLQVCHTQHFLIFFLILFDCSLSLLCLFLFSHVGILNLCLDSLNL